MYDVLSFNFSAQASSYITQVVNRHGVIAAEIKATFMAEEVITLSLALELGPELLSHDLDVTFRFYERADLIDVLHLLILRFYFKAIFDYN